MSRNVGAAIIALVVILILLANLGLLVMRDRRDVQSPIYALSQVEDGLDHHPADWVGKEVRVRATLVAWNTSCTANAACPPQPTYLLVNTMSDSLFSALEIQVGTADRWLQVMERTPLIPALVPRRPVIGAEGVYHLRLDPVRRGITCFMGRCYQGIVLGPAPAQPS